MSFVRICDLHVNYGEVQAVRGISFDIPKGEVFGFIGPNGAGKSSTIKVLATLKAPESGGAFIDGLAIEENVAEIRRRIGYMPDFFGVYEDLKVDDYLAFFAAAYQLPLDQRQGTIRDVLELTDLSSKRTAPVDSLSRGMKQRLALARVLLHDPDVLLLDEPASGLDPRARIEMRELLKALRDMGKTILISSHILHELAQLCTRIGIIEAGRMVAEGSLDDIYQKLNLLQVVHVQVVNLSDELVSQIGMLDGVDDVQVQSDRLSLQMHPEQVVPEVLLERIMKLGARVRMFQPEALDMETVFMKLTEGRTA
jgi:ABC-2 type transport system ATP-binding protein